MRDLDAEQVVQRLMGDHPFATETRAGVRHFKPGQHRAELIALDEGVDVGVLIWAPPDGHTVGYLAAVRQDGAWRFLFGLRLSPLLGTTRALPPTLLLTTEMCAALDRAEEEAHARP